MASYDKGWNDYVEGLKQAIIELEQDIPKPRRCAIVHVEWCEAIEHVVDELSNAIYNPRAVFSSDEQSRSIKTCASGFMTSITATG
jgi:hypothetical protein